MPVHSVIDKQGGLVLTFAEGLVTFAEIDQHQQRLLSDPDFDPHFNQLIDARAATGMNMSPREIRTVSERPLFASTSRRAIVATLPDVVAIARLMKTYHQACGEAAVFSRLDEAYQWLSQRDTASAASTS